MNEETTLQVLRRDDELQALQPAWECLWSEDPRASPFSHPAWLLPWWHSFAQPDLRAFALWREKRLLAVLPLYVLAQGSEALMLLLGAGTSDYLDAVVSPECSDEQLQELVRYALREPGWTVAHLNQLRAGSRLQDALAALCRQGLPAGQYAGEACSGCAAVRIADLPRKLRGEVLYRRNAALAHGRLRLVQAGPQQLEDTFALLVQFHTAQWQARGEPGVLADPAVLRHHHESIPLLHTAGLLRLMRLELEGEPIAVLYSLIDPELLPGSRHRARRTQYFYLMGHAPEWNELHPGVLLTAMAVEHAAAERVEWIDMLRGDETYKQFWHVQREPTSGFRIVPELS